MTETTSAAPSHELEADISRASLTPTVEPATSEPGAGSPSPRVPNPEVAAKPTRRTFTAEYKLGILKKADEAGPGGVGEILRSEGLLSSHLAAWRKARRAGALRGLSRGRARKRPRMNPLAKEVERLKKELRRLREQLRRAELIIEVQGKVAGLLGLNLEDGSSS